VIDEARALARGGDPQRALQLLEDFDRRFPSGVLAPEAEVARVEILVHDGDLDRARSLARRFLATHAESTATRRIRRLVPDLDSDEPPRDTTPLEVPAP
jgi:outer membrane protein assembly factor BamD (BamD/ComL family)